MTIVEAILFPSMFVGGTVGSMLGYIFPCLLHLKLKYDQLNLYQVVVDIILVCFGVVMTILGTAVSIKTLINFYEQ